jgi:hypothetical protein
MPAPAELANRFRGARGGYGVVSSRRGPSTSPALSSVADWLPLFGGMHSLARALDLAPGYLYRLVYGLQPWPPHIAQRVATEAERRMIGLHETILICRDIEAKASGQKADRRRAARIRFYERWGFWPETKADKEQRWARMKGPPGKEGPS